MRASTNRKKRGGAQNEDCRGDQQRISAGRKREKLVGLGRLELPTSPLSVVIAQLYTECDGLLSHWFSMPVKAIHVLSRLLRSAMEFDLGRAQNGAQSHPVTLRFCSARGDVRCCILPTAPVLHRRYGEYPECAVRRPLRDAGV
jgi:hypothetical protein